MSKQEISESILLQLRRQLSDDLGIYFPKEQLSDIRRIVARMKRERNLADPESFLTWLLNSAAVSERFEILTEFFTIGETYFFRDSDVWKTLANTLIPERIKANSSKKELKLWSVPCSTGEEAYSMAMVVDEMPLLTGWSIGILGTDINQEFLDVAENGIYRAWSFRNFSERLYHKYFTSQPGKKSVISDSIQKMVHFSKLNLAKLNFPTSITNTTNVDIIFCRNVLIYFDEELRKKIIQQLYSALKPGGFLLLAASETSIVDHPGLYPDKNIQTHFFRKGVVAPVKKEFPGTVKKSHLFDCLKKETETKRKKSFRKKVSGRSKTKNTNKNIENVSSIPSCEKQYIVEVNAAARKLYTKNKGTEAEGLLLQALEKSDAACSSPKDIAEAMQLLARIYADHGNLESACHWAEKGVETYKLNPDDYFFLSTVYQERGDAKQAKKLLQQVLFLDPDFVMAYFYLAQIETDTKKAVKHFQNTENLLKQKDSNHIVSHGDGMTAGRLLEIVNTMQGQ